MTVGELIRKLREYPSDLPVRLDVYGDGAIHIGQSIEIFLDTIFDPSTVVIEGE